MKNYTETPLSVKNWFASINRLDWRDDRILEDNIHKALQEAVQAKVWFKAAIKNVASCLTRAGRAVDMEQLTSQLRSLHQAEGRKSAARQPQRATQSVRTGNPPGDHLKLAIEEDPAMVIVDGTNVLFGSISRPAPSMTNLLGLMAGLHRRGYQAKAFFDASTIRILERGSKANEAQVFGQLCHDYPDTFIIVPAMYRADDFLLDFADLQCAPVISNDLYREYREKYPWLTQTPQRRASFLVHSGIMQIVTLGMRVVIPGSLGDAMKTFRAWAEDVSLASAA